MKPQIMRLILSGLALFFAMGFIAGIIYWDIYHTIDFDDLVDRLCDDTEFTQWTQTQAEDKLKDMCPSLVQNKKDFSMITSELAYHRYLFRKYYPRTKKKLQQYQDYWGKEE